MKKGVGSGSISTKMSRISNTDLYWYQLYWERTKVFLIFFSFEMKRKETRKILYPESKSYEPGQPKSYGYKQPIWYESLHTKNYRIPANPGHWIERTELHTLAWLYFSQSITDQVFSLVCTLQ
jgi:hypothetical protein